VVIAGVLMRKILHPVNCLYIVSLGGILIVLVGTKDS
jgi:hypothetical protein